MMTYKLPLYLMSSKSIVEKIQSYPKLRMAQDEFEELCFRFCVSEYDFTVNDGIIDYDGLLEYFIEQLGEDDEDEDEEEEDE